MRKSRGLSQAYDIQDFVYDALMRLKFQIGENVPDRDQTQALGTLGKLWRDAQEQIRIHRGKPLPGSLTPGKTQAKQRKMRASAGLSELLSSLERAPVVPDAQPDAQPPNHNDTGANDAA